MFAFAEPSRWAGYVSRRLNELSKAGGDFTGLVRPPNDVIMRAHGVAADLLAAETPTPSVVPSEHGEVLFVWHWAGWTLEIEVGQEDVSVWAFDRASGAMWSGPLAKLRSEVLALLLSMAAAA